MPMAYNIYVLAPLMLFFIAKSFYKQTRISISIVLLIVMAANSISFLRYAAIFAVSADQTEFALMQTHKKLKPFREMENTDIAITNGLWIFFPPETHRSVQIYNPKNTYDYILVQQYGSGLYEPKMIEGYDLIQNEFKQDKISLFGKRIGSYLPFYQYAVFKKTQTRE
jgi:hypothetical protein